MAAKRKRAQRTGTLLRERIRSRALEGNPQGDPAERDLYVYLPPGYDRTDRRYPVVVILVGFTGIAESPTGAVYVKDLERWRRDRYRELRTDYRSVVYEIPRETLFRHLGAPAGNYTINLKSVPLLGRLF